MTTDNVSYGLGSARAVSLLLAALMPALSWAEASGYKLGPGATKALTVESVYMFVVQPYEGKPKIALVKSAAQMPKASPEDALIAHFSAMAAGDYRWFLDVWSPKSRDDLRRRDAQERRGEAFWTSRWEQVLKGREIRLVNRIGYGDYVLIEYELDESAGRKAFRDTLAFKKEGSEWFLTQELSSDPVLTGWNAPGSKIKTLGVPPPKQ